MRGLLLLALVGCLSEEPTPTPVGSHSPALGTLYTCQIEGGEQQWCWDKGPEMLPGDCYPTPTTEAPNAEFCHYACPSDNSCLAFNGCFCP